MDRSAEGFVVDLHRRMAYFNIKVVHISTAGKLNSLIDCNTVEEFREAVKEDNERRGTLIIAKDLSREVIDALGTMYDIESEFFASHLAGTELYGMGYRESPASVAPVRAPNLLPEYIKKAPFYNAEFRRPYHIKGGADTVFKLRGKVTNLPRGTWILNQNLPDVFVYEKISVYRKAQSNVSKPNYGVISKISPCSVNLTSLPFSRNNHHRRIAFNVSTSLLHPAPSNSPHGQPLYQDNDRRTRQLSSRRELISYLQHLLPSSLFALSPTATTTTSSSSSSPLLLLPVLKIIERTSSQFLAYVRFTMIRILTRNCEDSFPDSIHFFLYITRSLHCHIHDHHKLLHHASRLILLQSSCSCDNDVAIAEQKVDFDFLAEDLEHALKALKEDVRFWVAAASIKEGKIVGWVSKFAALFLPVSLLATILAISEPGYTRWAILGGLSVPFVVVSVYFMFFWRPKALYSSEF